MVDCIHTSLTKDWSWPTRFCFTIIFINLFGIIFWSRGSYFARDSSVLKNTSWLSIIIQCSRSKGSIYLANLFYYSKLFLSCSACLCLNFDHWLSMFSEIFIFWFFFIFVCCFDYLFYWAHEYIIVTSMAKKSVFFFRRSLFTSMIWRCIFWNLFIEFDLLSA